ncbi:hypothetical protein GE061_016806 [Apolygus lucorum]|uniref:Uncharacterized protein n=1 Tax=Apolygus lucorum TaxID=248454 RepID=A0A8S9XH67_APOLU|nr:hypothetical protein GE061_016806 [Apolygus lucorum]
MSSNNEDLLLSAKRRLADFIREKEVELADDDVPVRQLKLYALQVKRLKQVLATALDQAEQSNSRSSRTILNSERSACNDLLLNTEMFEAHLDLWTQPDENPHIPIPPYAPNSSAKLPKLKIEKFEGNLFKFAEFWQLFETNIDQNPNFSPAEKFQYLSTYLSGKAKDCVAGYSITGENYQTAVNKLKSRFGDIQVLVSSHYQELQSLSKASRYSASLRSTYDGIEKHLRSLQNLGEDIQQKYFITTILSKFPPDIQMKIEKKRLKRELNVEDILEVLNNHITALERVYASSPRENFIRKNDSTTTTHALMGSESSYKNKKCFYCREDHYSDECSKFRTLEERTNEIKQFCQICFGKTHESKNCRQNKPCFHCKKKRSHHRSLCPTLFAEGSKESIEKRSGEEAGLLAMNENVLMKTLTADLYNPDEESTRSNNHFIKFFNWQGSANRYRGRKGRNALIQLANGQKIRRPVNRFYPLELRKESNCGEDT